MDLEDILGQGEDDFQAREKEEKVNNMIKECKSTMALIKRKMTSSGDLIAQFNDNKKECDLLKEELSAAKLDKQDILNKYNLTMEKVARLELTNVDYQKSIEKYKNKSDRQKTSLDEQGKLINQYTFKLKEVEEKNSTLEDKIKTLQDEIKSSKANLTALAKTNEKKQNVKTKHQGSQTIIIQKRDASVNTNPAIPEPKKPVMKHKNIMTDMCIKTEPFPIFCSKCLDHCSPAPVDQILKIMSSRPPLLSRHISPPNSPGYNTPSNNVQEQFVQPQFNDKQFKHPSQVLEKPNEISVMEIDKLRRRVNKLENLWKKNKTKTKQDNHSNENCYSSKNIQFVVQLPNEKQLVQHRKREKHKVKKLKRLSNKHFKKNKNQGSAKNKWAIEDLTSSVNTVSHYTSPIKAAIADHTSSVKTIADHTPSVKTIADHTSSVKTIADHTSPVKTIADHSLLSIKTDVKKKHSTGKRKLTSQEKEISLFGSALDPEVSVPAVRNIDASPCSSRESLSPSKSFVNLGVEETNLDLPITSFVQDVNIKEDIVKPESDSSCSISSQVSLAVSESIYQNIKENENTMQESHFITGESSAKDFSSNNDNLPISIENIVQSTQILYASDIRAQEDLISVEVSEHKIDNNKSVCLEQNNSSKQIETADEDISMDGSYDSINESSWAENENEQTENLSSIEKENSFRTLFESPVHIENTEQESKGITVPNNNQISNYNLMLQVSDLIESANETKQEVDVSLVEETEKNNIKSTLASLPVITDDIDECDDLLNILEDSPTQVPEINTNDDKSMVMEEASVRSELFVNKTLEENTSHSVVVLPETVGNVKKCRETIDLSSDEISKCSSDIEFHDSSALVEDAVTRNKQTENTNENIQKEDEECSFIESSADMSKDSTVIGEPFINKTLEGNIADNVIILPKITVGNMKQCRETIDLSSDEISKSSSDTEFYVKNLLAEDANKGNKLTGNLNKSIQKEDTKCSTLQSSVNMHENLPVERTDIICKQTENVNDDLQREALTTAKSQRTVENDLGSMLTPPVIFVSPADPEELEISENISLVEMGVTQEMENNDASPIISSDSPVTVMFEPSRVTRSSLNNHSQKDAVEQGIKLEANIASAEKTYKNSHALPVMRGVVGPHRKLSTSALEKGEEICPRIKTADGLSRGESLSPTPNKVDVINENSNSSMSSETKCFSLLTGKCGTKKNVILSDDSSEEMVVSTPTTRKRKRLEDNSQRQSGSPSTRKKLLSKIRNIKKNSKQPLTFPKLQPCKSEAIEKPTSDSTASTSSLPSTSSAPVTIASCRKHLPVSVVTPPTPKKPRVTHTSIALLPSTSSAPMEIASSLAESVGSSPTPKKQRTAHTSTALLPSSSSAPKEIASSLAESVGSSPTLKKQRTAHTSTALLPSTSSAPMEIASSLAEPVGSAPAPIKQRIAHRASKSSVNLGTESPKKTPKVRRKTKSLCAKVKTEPGDKISEILEVYSKTCEERRQLDRNLNPNLPAPPSDSVSLRNLMSKNNPEPHLIKNETDVSEDVPVKMIKNETDVPEDVPVKMIKRITRSRTPKNSDRTSNVNENPEISIKEEVPTPDVSSEDEAATPKKTALRKVKVENIKIEDDTSPVRELRSRQVVKNVELTPRVNKRKAFTNGVPNQIDETNSCLCDSTVRTALSQYISSDEPSFNNLRRKKIEVPNLKENEEFVHEQLNQLMGSEQWTSKENAQVVENLLSSQELRMIALFMVEYVADKITEDGEKLDFEHTPPAPAMTRSEQKFVTLVLSIAKIHPEFSDMIDKGLHHKLFRLTGGFAMPVQMVERLFRILVVLNKIKKDREKVRIFCCDALYCLHFRAMNLIHVALSCWPEILPKHGPNNDIIVKTIVHIVMSLEVKARYPKLVTLRKLLSTVYEYPNSGYFTNAFREELLKNLQENKPGINTAVLLLCKKMGAPWTSENIIKGGLKQMIVAQSHPSLYEALTLLGNLLRSFPTNDQENTASEIIDQLCDVLDDNTGSDDLQEGIVACLLSINKFNYDKIARSVIQWQSNKELRPTTIKKLSSFLKQHDAKWWWQFVKTNFPKPK